MIKDRQTFPRQTRLLASRDFQAVFSDKTSRSSDQQWTLLACQNNLNVARLGMAISKRVLKNAVDRNRIKRIARESFRLHQQELVGLDIVVMCRKEAKQATNEDLFDSLIRHWRRLKKSA